MTISGNVMLFNIFKYNKIINIIYKNQPNIDEINIKY